MSENCPACGSKVALDGGLKPHINNHCPRQPNHCNKCGTDLGAGYLCDGCDELVYHD